MNDKNNTEALLALRIFVTRVILFLLLPLKSDRFF